MRRARVLVASVALLAVSASACGGRPPAQRSRVDRCSRQGSAAIAGRRVRHVSWPERHAGPRRLPPYLSGLAVDPANQTAYELIARTKAPARPRYRLECVDLRTGAIRTGPASTAPDVTVAAGYLWLYGFPGHRARIAQVDLRSLHVIRSINLPGTTMAAVTGIRLAAGPAGSVWAGSVQADGGGTLFRLDARTAAVLATAKLPPNLAVTDLAVDPSGKLLYASAAHIVSGGAEGNVVLEYNATSGHRLAEAAHGLITDSVLGAALSPVPGGLWASFRTGMMGLTLHLRQQDLAMTPPTRPGFALSPTRSLFRWAMYATTIYGGGALWFASQAGIVACLDPGTGRPMAEEHVPERRLVTVLLAVDPAIRRIYGADDGGLVEIWPPRRCWSGTAQNP